MIPSEFEKCIGIDFFSTNCKGLGGRLRQLPEDFIVREILVDGMIASSSLHGTGQDGTGGFLVCTLEKRGLDTLTAIRRIAGKLQISENRINYGGLKDAKALTYQFVSIQRKRPTEISGFQVNGIRLFPVHRSNRPITSRVLAGNKFDVVLSRIPLSGVEVKRRAEIIRLEILKAGGVPNFFGHQRFGTNRPITHIVGRYLLKGDHHEAVMTYLAKPSVMEESSLDEVRRELLETMNFKKAYECFPRRLEYERMMLRHLSKRSNDWTNAIRRLPLRLRRLFIHAYQAYLFNRILSKRIEHGLSLVQVEPGDKVCKLDPQGNLKREPIEIERGNNRALNDRIRVGTMVLALPIIGLDTCFSEGKQGEIEREVIEEEGIETRMFQMPTMPELRGYGGYRSVMVKVRMLELPRVREDSLNKDMREVSIRFRLPKGSYATVVLREFMKSDSPAKAGY